MRIVRYYPRAKSGDGGMTNAVKCWSKAVAQAGHEVTIVYDGASNGREEWENGIRWISLQHYGPGRFRVATQLESALREADILVLHSGWTAYGIAAGATARRLGLPYILEPRGAYDPHIFARKRAIKRAWWNAFERKLVQNATAIQVFFDEEAEHIRALGYNGHCIAAPNGVSTQAGVAWDGGSSNRVLWMGRFDPEHKGLDSLVRALALIPTAKRPALELRGPEYRGGKIVMRRLISELGLEPWCRIEDALHGDEKFEHMAKARAFVYPSRWEAFGNSVAEAASLGVPVLTTPFPLGKLLAKRQAGVVALDTPQSLAEGLQTVCATSAAQMGARAQRLMRDEFSWDNVARSWVSRVQRVLHHPQTAAA